LDTGPCITSPISGPLKLISTSRTGWWFGAFFYFHIIIPTDELIFFRGVETTNQNIQKKMRCFSDA
jgi:membrane protease YdiL (CAAX protease family)